MHRNNQKTFCILFLIALESGRFGNEGDGVKDENNFPLKIVKILRQMNRIHLA